MISKFVCTFGYSLILAIIVFFSIKSHTDVFALPQQQIPLHTDGDVRNSENNRTTALNDRTDSVGRNSSSVKNIRVRPGGSANLECKTAGLQRRYELARTRARSRTGKFESARKTLQRLIQWYRVPLADQPVGVQAQPIEPDDRSVFLTPKYSSGGSSSLLPSEAVLTLLGVGQDGKNNTEGMYWCNFTDDGGQNVTQIFTVELISDQFPRSDDHNDNVADDGFYCYQCLPSSLNHYCTRSGDERPTRVACPSRRCLSMWAQCEGEWAHAPIPFAVCDPIEYAGWTEMVLQKPLVLEDGKCAVVSDKVEANILNDAVVRVLEPFSHIQNAIQSLSSHQTCRLQQITLCRCDTPGCNVKFEILKSPDAESIIIANRQQQPNSAAAVIKIAMSVTLVFCVLASIGLFSYVS